MKKLNPFNRLILKLNFHWEILFIIVIFQSCVEPASSPKNNINLEVVSPNPNSGVGRPQAVPPEFSPQDVNVKFVMPKNIGKISLRNITPNIKYNNGDAGRLSGSDLSAYNERLALYRNTLNYQLTTNPKLGSISDCLGFNNSDNRNLNCNYTPHPEVVQRILNSSTSFLFDEFKITITDNNGQSALLTVILNLFQNLNPTFSAQSFSVIGQNSAQSLGALSPAQYQSHFHTEALRYILTKKPDQGTLSQCLGLSGSARDDLTCTFTPLSETRGSDSFKIKVIDAYGFSTETTMTLILNTSGSPPVINPNPLNLSVINNQKIQNLTLTGLNISEPNGVSFNQLKISVTTQPSYGILSQCLNQSGSDPAGTPDITCQYFPNVTVSNGTVDTFKVTVTEPNGMASVGTVNLTFINNNPVAETKTVTVSEDTSNNSFTISNADSGDDDIVKLEVLSPLNLSGVFDGKLTNGTIGGSSCNLFGINSNLTTFTCEYSPKNNIQGTALDTLTFRITDAQGLTSTGTITFTVNNLNDTPTWSNQTITLKENIAVQNFSLTSASDIDPSETLSYSLEDQPSDTQFTIGNCLGENGSSDSDLDCTLTKVLDNGAGGNYVGKIKVTDGEADVEVDLTINLTVNRQAPAFGSDSITIGTPTPFNTESFNNSVTLDQASAPSGVNVGYKLVSTLNTSTQGNLKNCMDTTGSIGIADLSCEYDGPSDVTVQGTPLTSFVYQAYDVQFPNTHYDQLIVYINVTSLSNVAPVFNVGSLDRDFVLPASSNSLGALSADLLAATDGNNSDTITYSIVSAPTKGNLSHCLGLNGSANNDLSCNYKIRSDLFPSTSDAVIDDFDQFIYKASDKIGASNQVVVNINLKSANTAPTISTVSNKFTTGKMGIYGIEVTIDEGTSPIEDDQQLEVKVESSNVTNFPLANIKLYKGTTYAAAKSAPTKGTGSVTYVDFDVAGTENAGASKLYIDAIPADVLTDSTASKSSTLTLTVREKNTSAQAASGSSVLTSTTIFTATTENISADFGGWEMVKALGAKVNKSNELVGTWDRTLEIIFKPFTNLKHHPSLTSTRTISGYNVYRNRVNDSYSTFDFSQPVNSSLLTGTDLVSFTDTELTGESSTISTKDNHRTLTRAEVQWYRVLGVLNNGALIDFGETEPSSIIRVIAPPKNKALVHRWIANLQACRAHFGHDNNVNKTNNYQCDNLVGPGALNGHYDLGRDLLVDRYEVGCPYSKTCGTGLDEICINSSATTDTTQFPSTTTVGSILYDRYQGSCYVRVDAATWQNIDTLTPVLANKANRVTAHLLQLASVTSNYGAAADLPPLTGITQLEANNYCKSTSFQIEVLSTGTSPITYLDDSPFTGRLPSRKEYMVASLWSRTFAGETSFDSTELGSNLSTSTGCNSSNGGGLSFSNSLNSSLTNFEDHFPSRSNTTNPVNRRILKTASSATQTCQSIFGINDLTGNVQEWMIDRFYCSALSECDGVARTLGSHTTNYLGDNTTDDLVYESSTTKIYGLDGETGPCKIESSVCSVGTTSTAHLTSWLWSAQTHETKYVMPHMGLPFVAYSSGDIIEDLLAPPNAKLIGTSTNQFNSARFNGDRFSVNANLNFSGSSGKVQAGLNGVTSGGDYSNGQEAGRYNFNLIDSYTYSPNVGFRCVHPISY
jgi:hypothetical protein